MARRCDYGRAYDPAAYWRDVRNVRDVRIQRSLREIQCSATAVFGAETCTVSAFGIPIQLNDYSGNIFVPLLMAAVLAVVYRGLKRVIPDSVQLVFVPFLSLVVVFALTILVIGPLGIWLGSGLGAATAWLNAHVPFLFALIIPMLYPFLVPLGLHWPLNA